MAEFDPNNPGGEFEPDEESVEVLRQQSTLIEWLQNKWTRPQNCPICNSTNWGSAGVFELSQRGLGKIYALPPKKTLPVSVLACNICGYTLLFSSVRAEILPSDAQEASARDESRNDDQPSS